MDLHLPVSTQYALRAASVLSAGDRAAWIPAHDLVERTHVPAAYLPKVLRRLVAAGLLEATKGHHGGFRLALPPEEIRFADIITAMEDPESADQCQFGYEACSPADPCPLHPFFLELRRQLATWAENHTLADVDSATWLTQPTTRRLRRARVDPERARRG